MQSEIFKKIKNYPMYEISNYGKVRSWHNNKWGKNSFSKRLKLSKDPYGYYIVVLCENKNQSRERVGRLVLKTFKGKCPVGMETCHNDGNPGNDILNNLRWGSHTENMIDKKVHGTLVKGSKINNAILKETDIPKIFKLRTHGFTYNQLGQKFNVNSMTIHNVINRVTWKHIKV